MYQDAQYIRGDCIGNRQEFCNALRCLHSTTQNLLTAIDAAQKMSQGRQAHIPMGKNGVFTPYNQPNQNAYLGSPMVPPMAWSQQCPPLQQAPMYPTHPPMPPSVPQMNFNPMAANVPIVQGPMGYMGSTGGMRACNCCLQALPPHCLQQQNKTHSSLPEQTPSKPLCAEGSLYLPILIKLTIIEKKGDPPKIIPNSIEILKDKLADNSSPKATSPKAASPKSTSPKVSGALPEVERTSKTETSLQESAESLKEDSKSDTPEED